ncbi:TPA: hypothetical protein LWL07_002771 [Listeria monocytogenes]|nr:hypothetical protein [Listeria monocytogenes]EHD5081660.1 hypothetical protein [Listeria monocytogenes]HAA5949871.1 hypothetical protein [Listeria monocytogenes]HBM3946346.1 hypothetical protein [Listeria monocytogenes]HBM4162949.1 hypothetical protein [Listeria monocytogenes]
MRSFDVSTYFKSFVDDDKEALELLNEYIIRNNKRPVSVQFQVVHYPEANCDRVYIFAEFERRAKHESDWI